MISSGGLPNWNIGEVALLERIHFPHEVLFTTDDKYYPHFGKKLYDVFKTVKSKKTTLMMSK